MHLTTREVAVQNLKLGMYVSRLDIPWVQTPFPIQGFYLSSQDELDLLTHYCNKVYIDIFLSKDFANGNSKTPTRASTQANKIQQDAATLALMNEKARFKPRVEDYSKTVKLKKEMKNAQRLFDQISVQMSELYRSLEVTGFIDINSVQSASALMTQSIISNPNALAWLCRIHTENKALHQQSIRSAIWALIFARHLGLSQEDLTDIGTALLLAPVGKTKLPENLLKEQKTSEEILQYQQHVKLTLEETENMFLANKQVNYIISAYCERHNGTGFPKNLVGNKIPFLARVAGLADYYEQLINPYNESKALTPVEAISHLYTLRGNLFQNELIEKFIQAIGVYPTGSLVKLNDNSVGVVIEQPEKSRLRPRVSIIKNAHSTILDKSVTVDLAKKLENEMGYTLEISKSLKSTNHEIDALDIHNKVFNDNSWFSFLRA